MLHNLKLEIKQSLKAMLNLRSFVLCVLLVILIVQTVTLEAKVHYMIIDQINKSPDIPVLLVPGKVFCFDATVWRDIRDNATQKELQYLNEHHIAAIKRSIEKGIPAAVVLAMGLVDMKREAVIVTDMSTGKQERYVMYVHDQFDFYMQFLEVLSAHYDIKVNRYSTWLTLIDMSTSKLKYRNQVIKLIIRYSLWKFDTC